MQMDESALTKCLFFTSNRLSNVMRRMANDVYKSTGLSTPSIYLLIVVNQYPEITMTELSAKLDIAPSTCTRFVNALEKQGILRKETDWKTVHICLTVEGRKKTEKIDAAMMELAQRCNGILGPEAAESLPAEMVAAAEKLEESF